MNHRDEEMIGVLTAISVVSKRLANKLMRLTQTKAKGGKQNGQLRQGTQGLRRYTQPYC